jgi:hypothetical protein
LTCSQTYNRFEIRLGGAGFGVVNYGIGSARRGRVFLECCGRMRWCRARLVWGMAFEESVARWGQVRKALADWGLLRRKNETYF